MPRRRRPVAGHFTFFTFLTVDQWTVTILIIILWDCFCFFFGHLFKSFLFFIRGLYTHTNGITIQRYKDFSFFFSPPVPFEGYIMHFWDLFSGFTVTCGVKIKRFDL